MRFFALFFLLIAFNSSAAINKTNYFAVFESNSLVKIEAQIVSLMKEKSSNDKDAFLGAMIMKKSQFMKTPKQKIAVFKEGKILLESAILKRPKNITYHFLRLVIQENCPRILKYNAQIKEDKEIVRKNLNSIDKIVKKAITDYFNTRKESN